VPEVLELVLSFAFTTWAVFFIVLRDEKRLTPEQLARAWPPTTRTIALVFLSIFALVMHFVLTRRSLKGLGLGLGAALAVVVTHGLLFGTLEFFLAPDGGAP
jgi:hypothetical protein